MNKVVFVVFSALFFSAPTYVIAQEKISDQSFDERHSSVAVSGVNATLSFGYQYIDTGADDVFDFSPLPNSVDQANAVRFELQRENEFQAGFVQGSITFPLSETVGFQVDGLYSRQSSNLDRDLDVFGGGAHLFIRDPEKGLLGLYGQYVEYGEFAQNYQIGAELQVYHNNLNLEFFAGSDNLEVTTQSSIPDLSAFMDFAQPGIGIVPGMPPMAPNFINVETTIDNDFFTAEAIAAYYPKDNLRISAGIGYSFEETSFLAGLEWKPSNEVASNLFIDAQIGEDVAAVRAGIRFNFSQDARPLIKQHRDYYLPNRLLNNSASLASCLDSFIINGFLDPAIEPIIITPVATNPAGIPLPTTITFEPTTSLNGCDLELN